MEQVRERPVWGALARSVGAAGVVALAVSALSCEPDSVTAARDQLNRGPARLIQLLVPVAQDTIEPASLLPEGRDTLLGSLIGVRLDPESLSVRPSASLSLEDLAFGGATADLDSATLSQPPGTSVTFPLQYAPLAGEPRLLAVDTIVADSGSLVVVTQNRLPVAIDYVVTIDGFTAPDGSPLTGGGTLPAAPGDGSYTRDTLAFDLAGVTIVRDDLQATVLATATLPATPIDPALGASAVTQSGTATVVVRSITGPLDPNDLAELRVGLEGWAELPPEAVDFGDLNDALRESTLNDATVLLRVTSGAQVPIELTDVALGVAPVDAAGELVRDPLGNPVFETDSLGNPILVMIVDPGGGLISLDAALSGQVVRTDVPLSTGLLASRLVRRLLSDQRSAVVAAGTVSLGDGSQARIEREDRLGLRFDFVVGLDITIPDTGVVFTSGTIQDGLDLDSADANQIGERLETASATVEVINGTPFGLVAEVAYVGGDQGDQDVFALADRVELDPVPVSVPTVDANGRVTEPNAATVTVEVRGQEIRALLGQEFSVGVRVRLLFSPETGGRGALGAADRVILNSRVQIEVRSGGS